MGHWGHVRAYLGRVFLEALEHGEEKGSRLPRPRARHGHYVVPADHERDGLTLDRSWDPVALHLDPAVDWVAATNSE